MKTNNDGSKEYEETDWMELYGVTAPRAMWQAIGLELYSNSNDVCSCCPASRGLAADILAAQDAVGSSDGMAVIRRVATMRTQARQISDICSALREVKIHVPSNINVWQHVKGESRLSAAAETVASAAKQLVEMVSR